MRKKNIISIALSVFLSFVFVAVAVNAATTIGTNIDTGGTLTITGAVAASSTLQVTGATTLYSTLNVTGLSTLGNATSSMLSVTGMTYLDGGLTMDANKFTVADTSGNTSIGGTLTVTGNSVFSTASSTGIVKFSTINSDTGAISFGDENLTTTGAMNFATASSTGTATLDSLKVNSTGSTISGLIFGYCTIPATSVTASSTAFANCANATGITTGDRVIVQATSSLPGNFFIQAASSTAATTINVRIYNNGTIAGTDTGINSFNFIGIR